MNALTAQDAILTSAAVVEEWRREFIEQWMKPVIKQQARTQWARLSPDTKEILKKEQPNEYRQLMAFMQD